MERRRFIQSAAAAMSGLPISVERGLRHDPPVIGGMPTQVPVLGRRTGLRIRRLETYVKGEIGLVRLQTDDGSEGWGQVSTYDADLTAQVFHRKIAPHALGRDPVDLDLMVDTCIEANYKFPWSYVCRALTGLDTAVWDWLGRRESQSVSALLGGTTRAFPAYGSSMSRSLTPAQEAERLRRLRDERGFQAFKVRVGKVNGHDQDQWPGRTEELIPAVRRAVGEEVSLFADANSCYSPPKAIEVGRRLEDYGYRMFEEPCPYWELEWTAEVADRLEIPVSGGEQDNDLAQWRRLIRQRAVDIVQPDICYIGGLTRSLRVATLAFQAGMPVVPHSANLSLVTLFSLHLMTAVPNAGRFLEFTIEEDRWTQGVYSPALQVRDGLVPLPDGPGWGVQITPTWLADADRRESLWEG